MPEVRYSTSGAAVIGDTMYALGGWDDLPSLGHLPHADVFTFDLANNAWRRSAPESGSH